MAPDANKSSATEVGQAIVEISDRATLLIREEIELAKAEVTEKVTKLVKGAVVAGAAGLFVVVALLFLLESAAWGVYDIVSSLGVWFGFLVVAIVLLLLAALAGFLAAKAFKAGSPPVPEMAIDEAKKIKETMTSTPPPPATPIASTPVPTAPVAGQAATPAGTADTSAAATGGAHDGTTPTGGDQS